MEVRGVNGKLRFTVASIFASARYTYRNDRRDGLRLVKYCPEITRTDGEKEANSDPASTCYPPEKVSPALGQFPAAAER